MSPLLTVAVLTAMLQQPQAAPAEPPSQELLLAAVNHINAQQLDSAAILLRRVGEAPSRLVSDRLKAWILLGVVDYYRSGDSASADALRRALALDPEVQAPGIATDYPDIARILERERLTLAGRRAPVDTAPTRDPLPLVPADTIVYDCLAKCPEGVRAPSFTFFPDLGFLEGNPGAGAGRDDRRMRSFLIFHGVVGADGVVRPETVEMQGGTARGMESQMRRALFQARFDPARAFGAPASARVALRFDFEAEGSGQIRYRYRVVAC